MIGHTVPFHPLGPGYWATVLGPRHPGSHPLPADLAPGSASLIFVAHLAFSGEFFFSTTLAILF